MTARFAVHADASVHFFFFWRSSVRYARLASLFVVGTLSALVGCSSDSGGGAADTGEVDTGVSTFRPDDGGVGITA